MSDLREIFRSNYSPVLFIAVTNDCNMNCEYCYIHNNHIKNKVIQLGDIIPVITDLNPSKIILTGGEPLLYPKFIIEFIMYYEANLRKHWNIVLCTNLLLELTDERKKALSIVDWLQTTYSVDRFKTTKQLQMFIDNFKYVNNHLDNLEYRDINITLTQEQLKQPTGDLIDIIEELHPTGVGLELLSFDNTDIHKYDSYYDEADEYMEKVFEVLPESINLNYIGWKKCLDNNMIMNCNSCDIGCCKILNADGVLKNGCICNIDKTNLFRKKFLDMCVNCKYFKYCKMNCKRFGYYCGFPKKTFDKFLKKNGVGING